MEASLGSLRFVSATVTVGGLPFVCETLKVDQTQQQNADTMSADIPLNSPGSTLGFWASVSSETEVTAEIMGVPLFLGTLDKCHVSLEHQMVCIGGRDKSRGMIEAKSSESFKNKPSSQIVSEIAARHGLTPVIEATGGRAGKTMQIDWTHITDEISQWTLVNRLADNEGKVAYVTMNELHFETIDSGALGSIDVFYVPQTPGSHVNGNFQTLEITRNLQAGRPSKVGVHSWHSKKKQALHQYAQAGGNGAILNYDFKHAGLEPEQAQQIAQKRLREVKRQEITIEYGGPGNPLCRPRKMLNLGGTGAFDQGYYIDKVCHDAGHHGYRMNVTARNSKGGA